MSQGNPINSISSNPVPPTLQKRYEYDGNNNCTYQGWGIRGADESDRSKWHIVKYTYDGNSNCTQEQIAFDSWSNRVGATYA